MNEVDLNPRAVACMRGSFRQNNVSYDAEIMFAGKQYLIQTGFEDRDEAHKRAQGFVNDLIFLMKSQGEGMIVRQGFKEAKE